MAVLVWASQVVADIADRRQQAVLAKADQITKHLTLVVSSPEGAAIRCVPPDGGTTRMTLPVS